MTESWKAAAICNDYTKAKLGHTPPPGYIFRRLCDETGELGEALICTGGKRSASVEDELADIYNTLCYLSCELGVDLDLAVVNKLHTLEQRTAALKEKGRF